MNGRAAIFIFLFFLICISMCTTHHWPAPCMSTHVRIITRVTIPYLETMTHPLSSTPVLSLSFICSIELIFATWEKLRFEIGSLRFVFHWFNSDNGILNFIEKLLTFTFLIDFSLIKVVSYLKIKILETKSTNNPFCNKRHRKHFAN